MADCEDGELLDSDEELTKKVIPNFSYRNGNLSSDSSKSDSNSSDDEMYLKKKKHYHRVTSISATNNFSTKFSKAANLFQNYQNLSKKVNNIWSSVLEEQSLTQDLSKFDVQEETLKNEERGSESYHYWLKSKEENGHNNTPCQMDPLQRHGKKRSIKERIGKRSYDKNKIRNVLVTESDPLEKVVAELANKLQEPKLDLIERVVQTIGNKKALELYFMTEDVEEAGGMMIMDGSRRRTPGGVFFQLLKSDSHVTKEQRNAIFIDEKHVINQRRKARAKRKKKPNNFQSMLAEAKKEQARRKKRKDRLESKENQDDLSMKIEKKDNEDSQDEEKSQYERVNKKKEDDESMNEDDVHIFEVDKKKVQIIELEKDDDIKMSDIGMSDLD